jgi:uncharacterized repeat protein (TIGR01451 family)
MICPLTLDRPGTSNRRSHMEESMKNRFRTALTMLVLTVAAVLPASAQAVAAAAPTSLSITALNRTAVAEAELGAARPDDKARPGDVIAYTLTFTNNAGMRVRGVTFTNPIPDGLSYVANSAKGSRDDIRMEYSADGGETYSARPMEQVVVEGRTVTRPVDPARYTHVRWSVDGWVDAGAGVTSEFHARLAPAGRTPGAAPSAARSGR